MIWATPIPAQKPIAMGDHQLAFQFIKGTFINAIKKAMQILKALIPSPSFPERDSLLPIYVA